MWCNGHRRPFVHVMPTTTVVPPFLQFLCVIKPENRFGIDLVFWAVHACNSLSFLAFCNDIILYNSNIAVIFPVEKNVYEQW